MIYSVNQSVSDEDENWALISDILAVPGALAHRLQRRTTCKIQNGRQWPQNGRQGLERCLPLGFWAF